MKKISSRYYFKKYYIISNMSWRNTTNTNKMNSENRFDKFFKKKDSQTNTNEGKRFVNKTYNRDFSDSEAVTEKKPASYHGGFDPTKPRKQFRNYDRRGRYNNERYKRNDNRYQRNDDRYQRNGRYRNNRYESNESVPKKPVNELTA